MIDFNGFTEEMVAAQKAAQARGEKLIIFPDFAKLRASTDPIQKQAYANTQQIQKQKCKWGIPSCKPLYDRMESIGEQMASTVQQNGVSGSTVSKLLADLESKGTKLSSIIISGHDGNGSFAGEGGDLSYADLKAAADKNPTVVDGVHSLLLWGCYSTTPASIEFKWKTSLPNLHAIVGFNGSAPFGDKPASSFYLTDFLKKEPNLESIHDARELDAQFKSIRSLSAMTAAGCINGTYLQSHKAPVSLQQILGSCDSLLSNFPQCVPPNFLG